MCHLSKCLVIGVFVRLFLVVGCFVVDSALGVCVELVKFVYNFGSDGPPGVCIVEKFCCEQ